MQPMYTNGLPGRDWDVLAVTLDRQTIAEIEKDLFALIDYDNACAASGEETKFYDSWLFKPGVFLLDDKESDAAQQREDKLKASGSWYLQAAAAFALTIRLEILQITLSVLYEMSGDGKKRQEVTFADQCRRARLRPARDAREDAFLRDLTTLVQRKLGDGCIGDMTLYYRKDERTIEEEKRRERERAERAKREAAEREQRREAEEKLQRERRMAGVCQHCGGGFKGLFSRSCASCGRKKDY